MTNPQPTAAALDQFYVLHYRHYYQKVEKPDPAYIARFRKDHRAAETARFLSDHGVIAGTAAVLDIGASEGCILKAVRDLNPAVEATAVEPNREFGSFARAYAGCTVYPDLESLPAGQHFDLIILNHVFEHLKQPVEYLRGLRQRLTPAGVLYIDVPDLAAYTGLESLHVAHLYHFSGPTLRRALAGGGFEVMRLEQHHPVMHPASLRVLARANVAVEPGPVPDWTEDWQRVRRIDRSADRFHRRRWPRWRRIAYRISSRLRPRQTLSGS